MCAEFLDLFKTDCYVVICVNLNVYSEFTVNTLRTGDADLRFYITTVLDG